jgi:hypothetical protein
MLFPNFQRVLDEYDIPPEDYEVLEIENLRECSDIQDYMMELTGGRTVIKVSGSFLWVRIPPGYT